MKLSIVLAFIGTLIIVAVGYLRTKNIKKLLISIATVVCIVVVAFLGNTMRTLLPLVIAHYFLIVVSWGGLLWYLLRDKYYGWLIASPLLTLALFWIVARLGGAEQ